MVDRDRLVRARTVLRRMIRSGSRMVALPPAGSFWLLLIQTEQAVARAQEHFSRTRIVAYKRRQTFVIGDQFMSPKMRSGFGTTACIKARSLVLCRGRCRG